MGQEDYKMSAQDVADAFMYFCEIYKEFREDWKLDEKAINGFEACTALSDKLGRISRQIKHFERKDKKEDWPIGMTEAMAGVLIYMLLILDTYEIDMEDGMIKELESSLKQYSKG